MQTYNTIESTAMTRVAKVLNYSERGLIQAPQLETQKQKNLLTIRKPHRYIGISSKIPSPLLSTLK